MEQATYIKDGGTKSMVLLKCSKVRDGKDSWFWCKKTVFSYAKNNFSEGEGVQIEFNFNDGKYWLNKIEKVGGATNNKSNADTGVYNNGDSEKTTPAKYKCIDCGKELKDGKYKKCYDCNQKNPVKQTGTNGRNETIRSQALAKCVAQSLVALQGQINVNDIGDIIK